MTSSIASLIMGGVWPCKAATFGEGVRDTYLSSIPYACGAGEGPLDICPFVKPDRCGGGAGGGGDPSSSGGSGEGDLAGLGVLCCCHSTVDGGFDGS